MPSPRRLIALLTSLVLVLALAACSGADDADEPEADAAEATADTADTADEPTEEPADEPTADATSAATAEASEEVSETADASSGDLDALIADAQAEGELLFYSVPPEPVAQALADAFAEEYGITASFVRLTSADLQTRFSAEAESGQPAADMIMVSNSPFITDSQDQGVLEPLPDVVIPEGYPEDFLRPGTAVAQIALFGFTTNTDLVPADEAPETWQDLLDPRWQGQIQLVDPENSPANVDLFHLLATEYGIEYLEQLRAQTDGSLAAGTVPAAQAVGAGEYAIGVPNTPAAIIPLQAEGAPIDVHVPDLTTGAEVVIGLAAGASNPAAAQLFAHFVLSEQGNAILNEGDGPVGPYDADELPAEYTQVDRAESLSQAEAIFAALS
ncbi:ABC transporter substrate-binding protein [Euzebya sp.]|uniref:ABC transporter substrate-binding protein n=1 Tax=Euzebya sp. TaxID=1971409 RepID=UPI00351119D3